MASSVVVGGAIPPPGSAALARTRKAADANRMLAAAVPILRIFPVIKIKQTEFKQKDLPNWAFSEEGDSASGRNQERREGARGARAARKENCQEELGMAAHSGGARPEELISKLR